MSTISFYKTFFKNILLYMSSRLSKIRLVHTHVMARTVYFGWICMSNRMFSRLSIMIHWDWKNKKILNLLHVFSYLKRLHCFKTWFFFYKLYSSERISRSRQERERGVRDEFDQNFLVIWSNTLDSTFLHFKHGHEWHGNMIHSICLIHLLTC